MPDNHPPVVDDTTPLGHFLTYGLAAFKARHSLPTVKCFISYAWEDSNPNKRDALQTQLTDLQAQLIAVGCDARLDISNAQDRIDTYMKDNITAWADVVLVIATPWLKTRAAEKEKTWAFEKDWTPSRLDALAESDISRLNNLQKELWYTRSMLAKSRVRVFLLRFEGDFKASIPTNFFSTQQLLVADFTAPDTTAALLQPNNPVGLLPSLWQLTPDTPAYANYQQCWQQYQAPDTKALPTRLLRMKARFMQEACDYELDQALHFYVPLNGQPTQTAQQGTPLMDIAQGFFTKPRSGSCY